MGETAADAAEEARVAASVADVLAAAERLLALDLDAFEPAAEFVAAWERPGEER
jgi:hypothetical protein